jgi:hypothetical protein
LYLFDSSKISVIPYAKKEELELKSSIYLSIHFVVRHLCELWVVLHPHLFMQKGLVVLCRRARRTTAVLTCASLNSSFLADLMDDPLM